jgi:SpoVK/Ycf46/Vps4 family AAA+-type ATPase
MEQNWYESACFWYEKAKYEQQMSTFHSGQARKFYEHLQLVQADVAKNQQFHKKGNVKRKPNNDLLDKNIYKKKQKLESAVKIINGINSFSDIARLNANELDMNVPHLKQLNGLIELSKQMVSLIGLHRIKHELYQIVMNQMYLSLQKQQDVNIRQGMMNVCISGPPGTGKTTMCEIIGKMLASTGALTKGHLVVAKRGDLIGQFLGQTTPKTLKVLESALGGVLLIDEVYSLGGSGNRDTFAEECVNTLNEYMSLNAENLLVVIAGYKDDIESNFFGQNKGLKRRFPIMLELNGYNGLDLYKILTTLVTKAKWGFYPLDEDKIKTYITQHEKDFVYFAGDMESLLLHTKFSAAERVWKSLGTKDSVLTFDDVKHGHEKLMCNRAVKAEVALHSMYT